MSAPSPVVILSTADFDSAVWTNKQHLAVGLAQSRPVVYIESLGLRAPRLSRADLRRVVAKLRRRGGTSTTRPRPQNLTTLTPRVLPWHGVRWVRRLNAWLLARSLRPQLPVGEATFWSFSPLTYGLETGYARRVYHSVDLLHEVPGTPGAVLLDAERSLIAAADVVIASSRGVQRHLETQGAADVVLWENVAQSELFAAVTPDRERRAIFAGNLTPGKVDFALLEQLLERGVAVDLAGPIDIDGSRAGDAVERVMAHPLCRYLGLLPLPELAEAFGRCMVGLIPYRDNRYTAGVFPMKVHEYLAAGLEVVATPIPSLADVRLDGMHLATPEEFADRVVGSLDGFDEESARTRSEVAAASSWTRRIAQAEELLDARETVR